MLLIILKQNSLIIFSLMNIRMLPLGKIFRLLELEIMLAISATEKMERTKPLKSQSVTTSKRDAVDMAYRASRGSMKWKNAPSNTPGSVVDSCATVIGAGVDAEEKLMDAKNSIKSECASVP